MNRHDSLTTALQALHTPEHRVGFFGDLQTRLENADLPSSTWASSPESQVDQLDTGWMPVPAITSNTSRFRSLRWAIAAALVAFAAIGGVALMITLLGPSSRPVTTNVPTTVTPVEGETTTTTPPSTTTTTTLPVVTGTRFKPDGFYGELVVAEGALWAILEYSNELMRIDPVSGEATLAADLETFMGLLAYADTSLWTAIGSQIFEITPATGEVSRSFRADAGWNVESIWADQTNLWVLESSPLDEPSPQSRSLLRINRATGRVEAIRQADDAVALIGDTEGLWLVSWKEVEQLDPATLQPSRIVPLPDQSIFDDRFHNNSAIYASKLWIGAGDHLISIDTSTLEVDEIPIASDGCGPAGIAGTAGSIWAAAVPDSGYTTISEVDAESGLLQHVIRTSGREHFLRAADDEYLWLTDAGSSSMLRVAVADIRATSVTHLDLSLIGGCSG